MTTEPTKQPSNTKFYIILGALFVMIIFALIVFSPSLLGLIVQTQQTTNQTQETANKTQMVANDTNQETKNQTHILVEVLENQEQNRITDNNTTHKILEELNKTQSDEAKVIAKLEQESKSKELLLKKLEEESQQKVRILDKLENESKNKEFILSELERQSIQKQELLRNQNIQIALLHQILSNVSNITYQILNLTQTDNVGALEHRNSTIIHHEKLLELVSKLDKNVSKLDEKVEQNISK